MAHPYNRLLWSFLAFVAVSYTFLSILSLYVEKESLQLLLEPNATLSTPFVVNAAPYNITLPENIGDIELLIDLPGFKFLINNKRCDRDETVFLLAYVLSAATNFRKRQIIRDTWGNEENLPSDPVKVIFLLALVTDPSVQHQIEKENEIYHDIVQGNFLDTYRNLTYKHVMGLKWVTYFCRQARFVFKTDDDVFVDIFQLASFLKDTFGQTGRVANLMMGCPSHLLRVVRSYRSKWRVSFKEYPAGEFPPYCFGVMLLVSPDVAFKLYLSSSKVPYFWLEDVHVSGILARHIGISHFDISEKFVLNSRDMNKWLSSEDNVQLYVFAQSDEDFFLTLWNRTVQYHLKSLLPHE